MTSAALNSAPLPLNEQSPSARQPRAGSAGWGVIFTALVAALTFGILPALVWPERFRRLAAAEAERMHKLLAWARGWGATQVQLAALEAAGRRIDASAFFTIIPVAIAAFVAVTLGMEARQAALPWDRLVDLTYRFHDFSRQLMWMQSNAPSPSDAFAASQQLSRAASLHTLWCGALSIAYLAHWAQVGLHRASMRRFVGYLNKTIESRGMMPVRLREGASIMWPLAIVAAVVLVGYGAWWGIPMLLAGTAQRRYILTTSRALQVQLHDRMGHDLRRPTVARRCQADGCRALLPLPAKFCPQCGTPVSAGSLNAVG